MNIATCVENNLFNVFIVFSHSRDTILPFLESSFYDTHVALYCNIAYSN